MAGKLDFERLQTQLEENEQLDIGLLEAVCEAARALFAEEPNTLRVECPATVRWAARVGRGRPWTALTRQDPVPSLPRPRRRLLAICTASSTTS